MLNKKITCLLLSASFLTPAATAFVENIDPECVEAATNFIDPSELKATETSFNMCLYAAPLIGDVNSDRKVSLSDYTLLRRYINADGEGIKINEYCSDINYDGSIDFLDLLALKSML